MAYQGKGQNEVVLIAESEKLIRMLTENIFVLGWADQSVKLIDLYIDDKVMNIDSFCL